MTQKTEPTLEQMAYAALQEQHAEAVGSLARILDALDIDDSEEGWEDDAVQRASDLLDLRDVGYDVLTAWELGELGPKVDAMNKLRTLVKQTT